MPLDITIKTDQLHELEAYVGSLQDIDLSQISSVAAEFVANTGKRAFRDESPAPFPLGSAI